MEAATNSTANTRSAVVEIISRIANIKTLKESEDFYSAGSTSIMTLQILIELEEHFEVTIPDERFIAIRTAGEVAALITELKAQ